jgi:predicted O-linked N-acetylglucosamine transferase (SPINDLY family)
MPELAAADVYREHRRWDEQQAGGIKQPKLTIGSRDPGRRLRVGYVSPDLKQHSVAYFLEPLLREHDHSVVEVFCYAEVLRPDATTLNLQSHADHWLRTVGYSDDALARRITSDGIDILVDLAGHTADNRLGVFARKPAPVQVNWLGYPNTTGLRAMDYRLVDEITDPPGEADQTASERLIRLAEGFLCYAAPYAAPQPAPPPSVRTGRIVFGSFNNPAKLSSITLRTWATLMKRVPDSQLLLKGSALHEPGSRDLFQAHLHAHDIDLTRVVMRGRTPGVAEHLSVYADVDIALDPFPYNGTTTTCEALWMGVPVVTLLGDRHAARVGASLLTQIKRPELIADSPEGYVEIAAKLAAEPERLAQLRATLRDQMSRSPLCDAPGFAHKVETAYRTMWQKFCDGADAST